jgi:DNA-binding NarL/FixJ family response regulator
LIAQGKSNRQIAESLFVSVRTVESHRAALLKKLNQRNTAALVKFAIEQGYV